MTGFPSFAEAFTVLRENHKNGHNLGSVEDCPWCDPEFVAVARKIRLDMASCPIETHESSLVWEEGGPDKATIAGRWYCPECQENFNAVLNEQGARILSLRPFLMCDCCGQQRTTLPYTHDAHDDSGKSWDYCQECFDTGCSVNDPTGGCAL